MEDAQYEVVGDFSYKIQHANRQNRAASGSTFADEYAMLMNIRNRKCAEDGYLRIPTEVDIFGKSFKVQRIGHKALADLKGIRHLDLGDVRYYENDSLPCLDNLVSICVHNRIQLLSLDLFNTCNNVKVYKIGDECTDLCIEGGVILSSDRKTLLRCPSAKVGGYTIPESVTTIASNAFYGCSIISRIACGINVKSIQSKAFCNCKKITSIDLPANVTSLPAGVFQGCTSLKTVNWNSKLTSLGRQAFKGCTSIEEISLPETLQKCDAQVFEDCTRLRSVSIPHTLSAIPQGMFSGCLSIRTFTCNPHITEIEDRAFENCSSLAEVDLGPTLTHIGKNAFSGCSSLSSIIFSNELKSIGNGAFRDCKSLISINLPDKVEETGYMAFAGAENLRTLRFPASIRKIGLGCYTCKNLQEVSILSSNPPAIVHGASEDSNIIEYVGDGGYSFGAAPFHARTRVHVIKNSTYNFRAEWRDCTLIFDIEQKKITSLKLNVTSVRMKVDDEIHILAQILPTDAFCKDILWTSSDESKLVHLGDGVFYAVSRGTLRVLAQTTDSSHLSADCHVLIE